MEALELEDTIKNYEQRDANEWWAIDFDVLQGICCLSSWIYFFMQNDNFMITKLFSIL